jgi:hypothetical protein
MFVCLFVCLRYSAKMPLLTGRNASKSLTAYDVGEEAKGHVVDQKRKGTEPHSSSGRVLTG